MENTYTYRDYRNINCDILFQNFNLIDWDSIYYMPNVDDKLDFLDSNILRLFNGTVPLRTKTRSRKSQPWFNANIKRMIILRDVAYSRWKRFKTLDLREEFRVARRNVNNSIKRAKCEYYSRQFEMSLQSKHTWRTIRDIGICNSNANGCTPMDVNDLNDLNSTFTNLPKIQEDNNFYNFHSMDTNNQYNFEFSCVTEFDVMSSLLSLKSNATGYDNINP